jgi:hypothetical protein
MYGYEDCIEKLTKLLSETMASQSVAQMPNLSES